MQSAAQASQIQHQIPPGASVILKMTELPSLGKFKNTYGLLASPQLANLIALFCSKWVIDLATVPNLHPTMFGTHVTRILCAHVPLCDHFELLSGRFGYVNHHVFPIGVMTRCCDLLISAVRWLMNLASPWEQRVNFDAVLANIQFDKSTLFALAKPSS